MSAKPRENFQLKPFFLYYTNKESFRKNSLKKDLNILTMKYYGSTIVYFTTLFVLIVGL